jgi:hypothetical protein
MDGVENIIYVGPTPFLVLLHKIRVAFQNTAQASDCNIKYQNGKTVLVCALLIHKNRSAVIFSTGGSLLTLKPNSTSSAPVRLQQQCVTFIGYRVTAGPVQTWILHLLPISVTVPQSYEPRLWNRGASREEEEGKADIALRDQFFPFTLSRGFRAWKDEFVLLKGVLKG